MITYKVSKSYYHSDWNRPACQSKHGCWSRKVKTVKVLTSLNCKCCKDGHKETYYICEDHVHNLQKYLPTTTSVELKWDNISDPITNLFIK